MFLDSQEVTVGREGMRSRFTSYLDGCHRKAKLFLDSQEVTKKGEGKRSRFTSQLHGYHRRGNEKQVYLLVTWVS